MQILQLMKQRCSVRKFKKRPVEKEKLEYILEAARVAPSAANLQPWHFRVIQDQQLIAAIAPEWVPAANAPTLIVACGDHRQAWRRHDGKGHCDIDIAIAVDHMMLAAAAQGLGTCCICSFDAFQAGIKLELERGIEAMVLLPVGYPAEQKPEDRHGMERKTLMEIATWM